VYWDTRNNLIASRPSNIIDSSFTGRYFDSRTLADLSAGPGRFYDDGTNLYVRTTGDDSPDNYTMYYTTQDEESTGHHALKADAGTTLRNMTIIGHHMNAEGSDLGTLTFSGITTRCMQYGWRLQSTTSGTGIINISGCRLLYHICPPWNSTYYEYGDYSEVDNDGTAENGFTLNTRANTVTVENSTLQYARQSTIGGASTVLFDRCKILDQDSHAVYIGGSDGDVVTIQNCIFANFNSMNAATNGTCSGSSRTWKFYNNTIYHACFGRAARFFITNNTEVIDHATAAHAPGYDFWGTSRPQGSADDMGAHELDEVP